MAIASILITHAPPDRQNLLNHLGSMPRVLEAREVDPEKLALTIEAPAAELTGLLKNLADRAQVQTLELIFVNYEDDLDSQGYMETPPEAKNYE